MQNIAVIGLSVLLGLKDFFATKDGKKIRNVLIGIGLYFLIDSFIRKQQKQNALDSAPDDAATSFAIRLHDALVPSGLDWLNTWLGDGSNEAEIKQVAAEMKPLQNFAAVAAKYRTVYGTDLTKDLEKDGVFQTFQSVYKATTGGNTTGGTTTVKSFKVGKQVKYSASNWNIRAFNYPHKPIAKSVAGAIAGTVVVSTPFALTVQNLDGTFTKDNFIYLKNAAGLTYFVSKQVLQ